MTEPAYRIELKPPDITVPGRQYRDRLRHDIRRRQSGPHVLVCALTHGNEICGAIALDKLFRRDPAAAWPADAGLRQCRGLSGFDPRSRRSRYVDEDFNRLWLPQAGRPPQIGRTEPRPRAAAGLGQRRSAARPAFDAVCDAAADAGGVTAALARIGAGRSGAEMDHVRQRPCRRPRMRDYGGFGDPAGSKTALLIECGQHWERRAAQVAIDVMLRFLIATGDDRPATWRRSARFDADPPPSG